MEFIKSFKISRILFLVLFIFFITIFYDTSSAFQQMPHYSKKNISTKTLPDLIGRLNGVSCTGSDNALCIGAGLITHNGLTYPLIVKILDNGKNVIADTSVTNYSEEGAFYSTSCTGSGSNAVCIAAGFIKNPSLQVDLPRIVESHDGGATWTYVGIPDDIFVYGTFTKVSCTGGDSSPAMCIAVGWRTYANEKTKYPLLAQSLDGGYTWNYKSIHNLSGSSQGQLYSASCTGEGKDAMCVALGTYSPYQSTIPLLIQTNNGGANWNNVYYPFYSASSLDLTFTDVNCNGGNTNTICNVVGRIGTADPLFNPVVYQTTDRGITWVKNPLETFPANWNGTLNSVNCAGLGSNSFCSAVGAASLKPSMNSKKEGATTYFPLILQGFGNKWLVPSLNNATGWKNFYSTTCISNSNNFCFAVGYGTQNDGKQFPTLAATSNNLNWEVRSIDNLSSLGVLESSSCDKTGSLCIAVGYTSGENDEPLVVESVDQGASWNVRGIVLSPPSGSLMKCDTQNRCVAVPQDQEPNIDHYAAYYSIDGGKTWKDSQTGGYPMFDPFFSDLACGSNVTNCVAVGFEGSNTITTLVLRTGNAGVSWDWSSPGAPIPECQWGIIDERLESVTCDSTGLNCSAYGRCWAEMDGKWIDFTVNV